MSTTLVIAGTTFSNVAGIKATDNNSQTRTFLNVAPYASNPEPLGTASPGISDDYARGDHVHAMPSASDIGAALAVTEVIVATDGSVTQALDAGKIYHFTGTLTALTVTFNAPTTGQLAQYHFDFECGASAVPLTVPNSVVMSNSFTTDANTRYEVDILNNYAVVADWAVS